MARNLLIAILSCSLATGCVHTRTMDDMGLDLSEKERTPSAETFSGGLELTHVFYGKKANHRMLRALSKEGLSAVYVKIRNPGPRPRAIAASDFALVGSGGVAYGLHPEVLPHELRSFNEAALIANLVNVVAVVVIIVVILAVIWAMAHGHGGDLHWPSGSGGSSRASARDGTGSNGGGQLFNDTTLITRINYRHYLLGRAILNPGESREVVLFFRMPDDAEGTELRYEGDRGRPAQAL